MELSMLKSKIHRETVTVCDLNYEGSITIDAGLIEQAGILPHEQVDVLNINNGARFTTYARMQEAEAKSHTPRVILIEDKNNRPQKMLKTA